MSVFDSLDDNFADRPSAAARGRQCAPHSVRMRCARIRNTVNKSRRVSGGKSDECCHRMSIEIFVLHDRGEHPVHVSSVNRDHHFIAEAAPRRRFRRAAAPSRCAGAVRRYFRSARSTRVASRRCGRSPRRESASVMPSVSINAMYCLMSAFFGSVRMRTNPLCRRLRARRESGSAPCSSGMRSDGFETWSAGPG